jgi:hypothetical protein
VDQVTIVDKLERLTVVITWGESPLVRSDTVAAFEHVEPIDAETRLREGG